MQYQEYLQQITDFEQHYQYDARYLHEMLDSSVECYSKFSHGLTLVHHRELLEREPYWVARLATMKQEDCGACLQLNIQMAKEQDVAPEIIKSAISGGDGLQPDLLDIHDFALMISTNTYNEPLHERVSSKLSKGQLIELGICVGTTKLFPVIKRALGYAKSCSLMTLDV